VDGVEGGEAANGGVRLSVSSKDAEATAPRVIEALVRGGAAVREARIAQPSLEEAYLALIKEGGQ